MNALPRPVALLSLAALATAAVVTPTALADHGSDPTAHPRPLDADCDHFWGAPPAGVALRQVTIATGGPDEQPHPDTTVIGCVAHPGTGDEVGPHDGTLVVMAHGLNNTAQNAWAHHLVEAASHGAVAISVNFRDNFGFPALWGAHDVVNATHWAQTEFGTSRTILVGTSMGGNISGNAITEAPRFDFDGDGHADGRGLFDLWIDIEGLTNLSESYLEASAALPSVARGIERDAGGTPWEVPEEYLRRSPVFNADQMAAAGLRGVITTHGVLDGLVGFHQSRTMVDALRANGVPVEHTFVLTGKGDYDDTVLPDHAGAGAPFDAVGLTGHGWEGDRNHPVIAVALDRLMGLLDGRPEPADHTETVVASTP